MNNYDYQSQATGGDDMAEAIWVLQNQAAENYGFQINLATNKILELGSGNGIHLNHLQNQGAKNIQGVDAYLKHQDKFPDLDIKQADISNMPFQTNHFDVLLSTSIFDGRLYEEQDRLKMLIDMHRVLNPSGLYIGYESWESKELQNSLQEIPNRAHSIIIGMHGTSYIPAQN